MDTHAPHQAPRQAPHRAPQDTPHDTPDRAPDRDGTADRSRAERVDTVIIGGGQAGLAVAYHLDRHGHSAVIVERNPRLGDTWRRHYDSLRLYSPARYDGLPGMAFPADRWHFPTKDEVADFLETYADTFGLDVRTGVRVETLRRRGERFEVHTSAGTYEADQVVVATGTFGPPHRPALATDLDPAIVQLHSSEYRNPGQLQPGPVLVVGASHSGSDIAMDLATAGHETILCGRSTGEIPFRLEGRAMHVVFPVLWFVWGHLATIRTPIGRKLRTKVRTQGGELLRYRSSDLEAAGVERITQRIVGVEDGRPVLADGRVAECTNVVWCTGFRQDLSWIDLPITDEDGWPREHRGVVTDVPGLYFSGLAFQSAFRSMLIGGAGDDAAYVARHIAGRPSTVSAAPAV